MTDHTAPRTLPDLAALRDAIAGLPGPDVEATAAAAAREPTLTKPEGALGRLEELAHWAAAWQGRHPAQVEHPRVAVFAGNHGIAVRGVSAYPASVTAQMVQNFIAGGAAVNQLCRVADADLRVYELALDEPTADFTQGPAMSEADCAGAIAYGMIAIEPGIDLLAVGEMGIANTTAAAALCAALWGGAVGVWVGPGTGVRGDALAAKVAAVEAGLAANRTTLGSPLKVLAALGGRELAAIVGAVLAARLARVPVLLDGYAATAAASALYAVDRHALDHCKVAHLSAEPAHRALCDRIGQKPLLDLGMRLGEASGAALAIQLVRAATECHRGMATFAEAAVSGRRA